MTKRSIHVLLWISVVLSAVRVHGQDCSSPSELCAETINPNSIVSSNPVSFSCFNAAYTTYFEFTTNNNPINTGAVTVSLTGLNCLTGGVNDTLQAVIVEVPAGGDPCFPGSYIAVSDCEADTLDFSVGSDELSANSSYLVIVGTNHDPADGDCDFEIAIEGPAVDINACCDQEISLGETANITVTGGNAIPGYSWAPSVTLDTAVGDEVNAIPGETTNYIVTGYVGGCEVTDVVTILVGPPIGIPNTITPNGDQINDLWKISGISKFPNVQITVFDRWGQVVFKDIGYAQPWDGTNNGKELPTATYYYVIELNSIDITIEPISGPITLVH